MILPPAKAHPTGELPEGNLHRTPQWCVIIANKSLNQLKREDIEEYIRFCQKPPKSWIGTKKAS